MKADARTGHHCHSVGEGFAAEMELLSPTSGFCKRLGVSFGLFALGLLFFFGGV